MLALLAGCALPAASADGDGGEASTVGPQTSGAATSTSTGSTGARDAGPSTQSSGAATSSSGTGESGSTVGLGETSSGGGSSQGGSSDRTTGLGSDSSGESSTGDEPVMPLETVFESFTEASGLDMPHECVYEVQYPPGIGIRDFDGDGHQDLFLTSWEGPSRLWLGDGVGRFSEAASGSVLAEHTSTGVAVGDYDNDGDLDLYVTDIAKAFLLQNQTSQGEAVFLDVTETAGVDLLGVGWGAVFADYDNDGWQDLYVAQGTDSGGVTSANVLFHNLGDGTFDALGSASGAVDLGFSQAVAFGDLDEDGFLDLVVGNRQDAYAVYRNRAEFGAENNWVEIDLRGAASVSADAAGARAWLSTADGLTRLQEVKLGSSMSSTNMLPLHFGLGAHDGAELSVLWPDGETAVFTLESTDVNQRLVVSYPGTILPG